MNISTDCRAPRFFPFASLHLLLSILFASTLHSAETPSIQIVSDSKETSLLFRGLLQSAPSLPGPWTDLPNASSPWTLYPSPEPAPLFFRTREPVSPSIFSASNIVQLTLIAPFQTHFNLAFAGTPDGIFPPKRTKNPFEGTVSLSQSPIPATFRVRGNSSLQECPFPKLTLKVSPKNRVDTPFYNAREIKIGSHCAEGGFGNIGRLRDERAPFREALAYEMLQLLHFTSPRVRRAQITFSDISPTNSPVFGGWIVTRHAMLLDDAEVVGERLGGRALDDEEIKNLSNAQFSEQLIADLRLFHALIGNWDFALSTSGTGLWNTDVIELPNKQLIPLIGDFDLASWVTGRPRPLPPHDYLPELTTLERNTRYVIQNLIRETEPPTFNNARARFESQKETLQNWVHSAAVDEEGRTNALQHLEVFFSTLEALTRPR